ncbi:hypothetical protein H4219_002253 [Mycoemilia scoparia]|uniref:Uncharacterized protein n=1 Tax=Mycoemilia scoparia TaxID=417184 RepID=A0A9W7ZYT2_9FUNG|nr:hypothetical protein H4219_002253 [Mycoemilia scoparia]
MMQSGISRRRVANSTTPHLSDEEDDHRYNSPNSAGGRNGSSNSPNPDNRNGNTADSSKTGEGNSSNNGAAKREREPILTLMDEVLLLGLKDNEGYLSFWNDSLSYVLRACILMELALRKRIRILKDAYTGMTSLSDRKIDVVSSKPTGEVLLDEALRLMKQEHRSVMSWIDLLSGETWNISKAGYQLKQVRERLAKALVEKGVLRTEKRNFLLFDMATHPVQDRRCKSEVIDRLKQTLGIESVMPLSTRWYKEEETRYWRMRRICMACAAFSGNVIENPLVHLSLDERDFYVGKAETLLNSFSQWPFKKTAGLSPAGDVDLAVGEVIACVLTVLRKMDRII